MDYQKIYNSIIENAKSQNRKRGEAYYENHHILPRCLGGSNEKSNLVLLTAREHYVCHKLLVEIHPGHRGLVYAFHRMIYTKSPDHDRDYKISSREFERMRIICSENLKGEKNHMYGMTGEKNPFYGKGWKLSGDKNGFYGKKHSSKTKSIMKENHADFNGEKNPFYGKTHDKNKRDEISKKTKEEYARRVEKVCPYCGYKSKHYANMSRYHFENCKYKKISNIIYYLKSL